MYIEVVLVLAYIFVREIDIKQLITKIDIYNCGKCSTGKVRTFNKEPNLIRKKGRLAKVS